MGRKPFMRNNLLWISGIITAVGLALTVLAFTAAYPPGGWNEAYENLVPCGTQPTETCWNTLVRVVAPVILIVGIWYVGEQVWARRKFDRLLNAEKKSEFVGNVPELEKTAKLLPKAFEERLEKKETDFKSKR